MKIMKTELTIRRQMARIWSVHEKTNDPRLKDAAWEAWHALRWVAKNVSWSPVKDFEDRLEGESDER